MAITVNVEEVRNNQNDKTVYFTIAKNATTYKFHADIPLAEDPLTWLQENKQKIIDMIQAKIAKGTFKNEHPKWVGSLAQIDAISNLAGAKAILKKIVKYIGR